MGRPERVECRSCKVSALAVDGEPAACKLCGGPLEPATRLEPQRVSQGDSDRSSGRDVVSGVLEVVFELIGGMLD